MDEGVVGHDFVTATLAEMGVCAARCGPSSFRGSSTEFVGEKGPPGALPQTPGFWRHCRASKWT